MCGQDLSEYLEITLEMRDGFLKNWLALKELEARYADILKVNPSLKAFRTEKASTACNHKQSEI